ncbi:MAG: DUF192 domain-containing protein [Polyangiales bacterium]
MKWGCVVMVAFSIMSCGDAEPAAHGRLIDHDGRVQLEMVMTIADTEYTRQEGLRLYGPLAKDEALLLVFPTEGTVCITNAGVPFAIDVVFVSAAGLVTATEPNIPADAPGPFCHPTTAMALELPGDTLHPLNYWKLELF